ncbi:hypothetical protein EHS25_004164 [Saitozyma podzolica]|uniref:Uncharacterized protein n=1 Tax=Saitozyma podzolica TaxID=1890683 RepID=A0A427YTP0_9TREE|nr:hypothetical protein EHS25_004164 [Saitozyma podzolica]
MNHPDPSPLPSLSPSSSSSLRSLPSTRSGSDVQHPVHDSGTASIVPPALPPRPRSRRVSVPPLVPEQSRPRGAVAGASPPSLPLGHHHHLPPPMQLSQPHLRKRSGLDHPVPASGTRKRV